MKSRTMNFRSKVLLLSFRFLFLVGWIFVLLLTSTVVEANAPRSMLFDSVTTRPKAKTTVERRRRRRGHVPISVDKKKICDESMVLRRSEGGQSNFSSSRRCVHTSSKGRYGSSLMSHLEVAIHTETARFLRKPFLYSCVYVAASIAKKKFVDDSSFFGGTKRALYFWKYGGPIVIHYKFTQWWLKTSRASLQKRHIVYGKLHDRYCQPSLRLVQSLQGLYVKLAQTMSSRPDFMPRQYVEVFSTVQDSIPQWPVEQVTSIVRESFRTELDLDYDDVFESIDPIALGSASIGQVHRAVLKDAWVAKGWNEGYNGGKIAAVKVMHPESRNRFSRDFQVFRWLCRIAMPGWRVLLDDLEVRLMTEFDYRNEAASLSEVRSNILASPYRQEVLVPQPHPRLCSKLVLVMEMLEGKKVEVEIEDRLTWMFGGDRRKASELINKRKNALLFGNADHGGAESEPTIQIYDFYKENGLPGVWRALRSLSLYKKFDHYVNLLVDVHGHQMFVDGCFNGDPHPGNVLVLCDGKRLGLIDYGQTRRLETKSRLDCAHIIVALAKNPASLDEIAETMTRAGFRTQEGRKDILVKYAKLFFDSDHESRKVGCPTPQHYFARLMEEDPLVDIPDFAVSIARVSILFRGAGAILNRNVETAPQWSKQAKKALQIAVDNEEIG